MKKTNLNLIPDCVNPSPDYYCTWQTQLYATCDGKPKAQRAIIGEKAIFEKEKPFGWAYFYEEARKDLFFVMDDSWDVPRSDSPVHYGSLILNDEKFPEATRNAASNEEALNRLSDRIRSLGWKGLGGWICAQESPLMIGARTREQYWEEKITENGRAGIRYWKVDWGKRGTSFDFRKKLTEIGKAVSPGLTIEHAMVKEMITQGDVYRTYDVPALMSIPMTMEKLSEILTAKYENGGGKGLINCEDEVYTAAAGGFTMGIMRHPYSGAFVNNTPDMSFPQIHRNIKTKIHEVIRSVRWHRIAPAFGINKGEVLVDETRLTDTWSFLHRDDEMEAWWFDHPMIKDSMDGEVLIKSAPARIARNCELPRISPDQNGNVPYLIAAKNPNGAFSVATLGRTLGREYFIPRCDVTINIGNSEIIAAFGEYRNLYLLTSGRMPHTVLMQDLADDTAYDITESIEINGRELKIAGELIRTVGTASQPREDTSEPGVVISLRY